MGECSYRIPTFEKRQKKKRKKVKGKGKKECAYCRKDCASEIGATSILTKEGTTTEQ